MEIKSNNFGVVVRLVAVTAIVGAAGLLGYLCTDRMLITASDASAAEADGRTLLIDIREPEEIAQGTTPHATRVTFRLDGSVDESFVAGIGALATNKSLNITLMCRTGVRSAAARDLLAQNGYSNVKSLAGGFEAWREQGLLTTGRQE